MFTKVTILLAAMAAVSAHYHGQDATSYASLHLVSDGHDNYEEIQHHSHPKYTFKYGVEDLHTGDIKSQEEQRDGDSVHGSYSLVQPDGTLRVVNYRADGHSGFQAHVKIIGKPIHPAVNHHQGW